jgi:SAM-dependent methyltransferase
VPRKVPKAVRKRSFGRNPPAYDRARLAYPRRVYDVLRARCGLRPGAAVFEVGPGTGIATRELLRLGADPITLVEPDRRLARFLREALRQYHDRVTISSRPFERAALPAEAFDLGVAASSFHWLPEQLALRKVARALRPGGWWATWNNRHGDPYRSSAFFRALQPLYRELSPGRVGGEHTRAYASRDRRNRLRALESTGKFERISREEVRWSATLTTARVQALWGTFSDIITLPPRRRAWFLAELGKIADERFGGEVTFPVLTPLYTARRL